MSARRWNATKRHTATVTPNCDEIIKALVHRGHWNKSEMIETAIREYAQRFVKRTGKKLEDEHGNTIEIRDRR